jgi:sugar lactone lactonase YvrE
MAAAVQSTILSGNQTIGHPSSRTPGEASLARSGTALDQPQTKGELDVNTVVADILVDARAITAESPVWDDRLRRLLWVDVHAKTVYRLESDGTVAALWAGEAPVGFVNLADEDRLVAGAGDRVILIDRRGDTDVWRCDELVQGGRFNDAKCDSAGRLWAGTMAQDETPGAGALYRISADSGSATIEVQRVLSKVTVSNGMGWSPDGETMYYVDSPTGRVDAFTFRGRTGDVEQRRPFVNIPVEEGEPDGLTVDSEGCVWVAVWGGWEVRRFTPHGELDSVVRLPVQYPTSCTLGGTDLRDLYITTSSFRVDPSERSKQPLAGGIFSARAPVSGMAADRFAVRATP